MNEVLRCMLTRRSYRKYKPEQIRPEELEAILQAGVYAPAAGGRQWSVVVACQDRELNQKLGEINRSGVERSPNASAYVSREQPSIADDNAISSGFYGAPTVVTIFGAKNFLYAIPDCSVIAENIMLAAHSLGIGSCMVMRAEDTFASELGQKLQQEWGVPGDYEAKAHVTLGYPAGDLPKVKPRKDGRIIKIG